MSKFVNRDMMVHHLGGRIGHFNQLSAGERGMETETLYSKYIYIEEIVNPSNVTLILQ
jgi:hypothetical protein